MARVGFLGLGSMGQAMARRLLDAGHDVVVWNRSAEPRAELSESGATAVETPRGGFGCRPFGVHARQR